MSDGFESTEWRISVEKRLADLEARLLGPAQAEVPAAISVVTRALGYIQHHWDAAREPLPMRVFSGRFARQAKAAGLSVDRVLEELVGQNRVTVGITGTGRRVLLPREVLYTLSVDQKAAWGLLSEEEREALAMHDVEMKIKSLVHRADVGPEDLDPDKMVEAFVKAFEEKKDA